MEVEREGGREGERRERERDRQTEREREREREREKQLVLISETHILKHGNVSVYFLGKVTK